MNNNSNSSNSHSLFNENNSNSDDEKVQKGVMGRVLVLLMDPPTKQYELTSLPYPLVSNDHGIIGPTQIKILLSLVSKSASYEPLRDKEYTGFCRPGEAKAFLHDLTILDYRVVKDEVLVAIPAGYSADDCERFSKPILQDKRLVRLLRKLKKHEKKAEKKRKLKEQIYAKGASGIISPRSSALTGTTTSSSSGVVRPKSPNSLPLDDDNDGRVSYDALGRKSMSSLTDDDDDSMFEDVMDENEFNQDMLKIMEKQYREEARRGGGGMKVLFQRTVTFLLLIFFFVMGASNMDEETMSKVVSQITSIRNCISDVANDGMMNMGIVVVRDPDGDDKSLSSLCAPDINHCKPVEEQNIKQRRKGFVSKIFGKVNKKK